MSRSDPRSRHPDDEGGSVGPRDGGRDGIARGAGGDARAATARGAGDAPRRSTGRPEVDEARRARRLDLDGGVYARRRHRDDRRRRELERRDFTPAPDEDDWTIPDRSGRRRMPGIPEPVGDLLGDLVEGRGWSERMRSAVLFARWSEVVGEDVARNCDPVRLVGGVLVVATSSTSWATQLRYLANDLRRAVNQGFGEPLVDRVDVQVRR